MDFERRSAIEYLSLQNAERTHAEMLAWLMSDSSLLAGQRLVLLRRLLGGAAFSRMDDTDGWKLGRPRTEVSADDSGRPSRRRNSEDDASLPSDADDDAEGAKQRKVRLDLVLELTRGGDRYAVVFEYKMKSTQSLQQLAKYDREIARILAGVPKERIRKVLLTFDGAQPESGDGTWLARSFDDLLRELAQLDASQDRAAALYIEDYTRMLGRLLFCRKLVLDDREASAMLLPRRPTSAASGALAVIRDYVTDMKVTHLLNKAWLEKVFLRAQQHLAPVGLTQFRIQAGGNVQNGDAILNVYLAELVAPDCGMRYRHGLQLQGDAFKAFVEPYPDRKIEQRELRWTTAIHQALAEQVARDSGEWELSRSDAPKVNSWAFRSKTLTWLSIGGERVHRRTFKTDFDIERRAEAVAYAIRRIRATTPSCDFGGFTWTDLIASAT